MLALSVDENFKNYTLQTITTTEVTGILSTLEDQRDDVGKDYLLKLGSSTSVGSRLLRPQSVVSALTRR